MVENEAIWAWKAETIAPCISIHELGTSNRLQYHLNAHTICSVQNSVDKELPTYVINRKWVESPMSSTANGRRTCPVVTPSFR